MLADTLEVSKICDRKFSAWLNKETHPRTQFPFTLWNITKQCRLIVRRFITFNITIWLS